MTHKRFIFVLLFFLLSFLIVSCGGGGSSDSTTQSDPQNGSPYAYEWLMDSTSTGPLVAAHRGAHENVPENSLASIRAASVLGADFAEIDVRHTSDGVLVLMHDSNVSRTAGVNAEIETLTYAQVQALTLLGSNSSNQETLRVPTFEQALALASEVSVMLYVDIKTDRYDLIVNTVQAGSYQKVALLRDYLETLINIYALDSSLLLMPPVGSINELNAAVSAIPNLKIVEYSSDTPNTAFCAAAKDLGIKVQQDVITNGDIPALLTGSYSGWKSFIDAGVWLLQTDQPDMLVPAVLNYRETGVLAP